MSEHIDPIVWPCPECGAEPNALCRSLVYRGNPEMPDLVHTARVENGENQS